MRRVLMVQPSLQPPGGGNGVAAWMLQALARTHRVTVLSWRPVDLDPINRFFGTSLQRGDFDAISVPRRWTAVPDHLPVPAALIRSGLLMRYARRHTRNFDVIVGVHNEADYGRRGIQYVHYPTYFRPRPASDLRWYHRWGPGLSGYYRLADGIADFSLDRMRSNLTLANSEWTAGRIRTFLRIDAETVYPPVVGGAPPPAWADRRRGFVAIGRLSPEKEYERIIRILATVRQSAPDITLTIVGTWDRHVRRYYEQLRTLASSLGSWVEFRHDLTRDEVRGLLARCRYGIHGMREEHFGMAPAEMVRAGMIVWVPNGGGQVEIVDREPALVYDTEPQAADSVTRVITNAAAERALLERLAIRSEVYSVDRFVNRIQSIVRDFRE